MVKTFLEISRSIFQTSPAVLVKGQFRTQATKRRCFDGDEIDEKMNLKPFRRARKQKCATHP